MTMHWSVDYVGTPYVDHGRAADGCDCWGLVRLVLSRERHVLLPSYASVSPSELREIAEIVARETGGSAWCAVTSPQEFDVVVFRRGRFDSHVGLMVDTRRMLHSDKQAERACVERVDAGRWKSQLVGYFRHRELI